MQKGLILVVDDEENILSALEGILHDDGYDVVTVDEGETALDIIESDRPDLVLLDIWLPGMDGIEVLKSAHRAGSEAEFIMMSGHGSIETAVQATKLGAFDFIEKPLSLDHVLLTVKLAMEKRNDGKEKIDSTKRSRDSDRFAGVSEDAKMARGQLESTVAKQYIPGTGNKTIGNSCVANHDHTRLNDADSLKEAEYLWDKESIAYHLSKNNWDLKKTAKGMRLTPTALEKRLNKYAINIEALKKQTCFSQKTLKKSVVLTGQGLHSGNKTGMILSPLPPNSGILFGDISTGETIRAHLDHVKSTDYATSLRRGNKVVRTVEHILAALHMYQISNLMIKMGDEVPIMDGSANDFCALIEGGGIEDQNVLCEGLAPDKTYSIGSAEGNGKHISIEPADRLEIHYMMNYPPPIGHQEFLFKFQGEDHFKREIAPARTFGFLKDYEKLEEMGLATGGRLSNLILMDNEKVINTNLRFPDEFVRHKILDIIGDFYLLGRPVRAKITARMTGHQENIALLRKIRENHQELS